MSDIVNFTHQWKYIFSQVFTFIGFFIHRTLSHFDFHTQNYHILLIKIKIKRQKLDTSEIGRAICLCNKKGFNDEQLFNLFYSKYLVINKILKKVFFTSSTIWWWEYGSFQFRHVHFNTKNVSELTKNISLNLHHLRIGGSRYVC